MTRSDDPRGAVALLARANPTDRDTSLHELGHEELAAAHVRVMQLIAAGPDDKAAAPPLPRRGSQRRRATRASAAVLALAAAATVALLALPAGNQSGELSLVNAVAQVAASRPPVTTLPPGKYFHMLVRDFRNVSGPTVINDTNIEYWVGSDGSGLVRQSTRRSLFPGGQCPPSSPPPKGFISISCAASGDMIINDFRLGPRGLYRFQGDYVETWVRSLPTNQHSLKIALQKQWASEYANTPGANAGEADSAQLLGLIGSALGDPLTSPAVRSSLFRFAGTLPDVTVRTGVTDAYGRTGTEIRATGDTGVALPQHSPDAPHDTRADRQVYRLIFDPATSLILDSDITVPGTGTQGTILLAYFDQRIVGSLPTNQHRP